LLSAADTVRSQGDIGVFAFAVAAWMRYCLGYRDDGVTYELRDPRQQEIAATVQQGKMETVDVVTALMALDGLFPDDLRRNGVWARTVAGYLEFMRSHGMTAALAAFPRPVTQ